MERRRFLAFAASSLTGGLAGCTGMSSTVGDIVEDRSGNSGSDDLNVKISTSGPAILIKPTETLPLKTELHQDGEQVTSVEMSGVNQSVYHEIINCDKASDPDKRMFEPGTIELVFLDFEGEQMGTKEWEFQPYPVVEDFTIATVSNYDPTNYLSETTPVFRVRNIGTGPTCITDLEITNPRKTVTVVDGEETVESPMLQTGKYSIDDSRISLHETPNREARLLPVERNSFIAFDGLFTATAPAASQTTGDTPDTLNQSFDVVVHTAFGESYTTTVDIAMVGGLVSSDSSESEWTHRYRTVRFDSVSHGNP
jgi:hypothetical protein